MRNFGDTDSRGGRRGGFRRGRKSFGGGRNFGDRQMFKAICSNCGKECEVPFNPTGEKPVYCSDCFEKMGKRNDRRSFDRPRRDDRNISNEKYEAHLRNVNAKLDKILNLLQPKELAAPVIEVPVEAPIAKKKTKSTKAKKASKSSSE